MTTEQLRYFITVITAGSYMEAALELNISQSTVSKQIQALERELGVSLFDRSSRKAQLTAEGQKLLPEARTLLKKIDHFFYSAAALQPGTAKHFTVITLPFVGFLNLYTPLNRFEVAHSDFRLEVIEMEEPQLTKQLTGGDFDIAITYDHEFQRSNTAQHFYPVAEDEAVFAVYKEHPLSQRKSITLKDITNIPLLLMGEHTCIAKLCEDYFAKNNFLPWIIFRGMPDTLVAGVKAHRGCAIISKKQAQFYAPGDIVTIPFDPPLPISIGIVPNEGSPRKEHIPELLAFFQENTRK